MVPSTRADCEALDRADPLASRRAQFALPDGVIYLDGHSLGPATHAALASVEHTSRTEWAQGLIRSWNDAGWIDLPSTVGARLARLIGVKPEEVIVADSVSVNLFKLAAAALPLVRQRVLIVEDDEFPTDQYIAEGLSAFAGVRFIRAASGQGAGILAREGGILIKSIVNYRTSLMAGIAAHEAAASSSGGLMLWDLSHATGVLDVDLSKSGLAAGCTYKFVNGGPGAPAFVYVRSDLISQISSPLSGWMGHAAPFAFDSSYAPKSGIQRFASGTPTILSLAALNGALDAFDDIDLKQLAAKARALGDLCLARGKGLGLEAISPSDPAQRGAHVSLLHPEGYAIVQALIARNIIADFRAPDAMRFGFSPLYIRYVDVWDAMEYLADILRTRAWDKPEFRRRAAVT